MSHDFIVFFLSILSSDRLMSKVSKMEITQLRLAYSAIRLMYR